ncbi:50S ribosomal protein L23 [bacterium]|jgi:large subunit ribosomal protein L23|nr:50S ribosomal protein L23 [bacterium]MBT4649528.1 50S ribosomal protein L23 [bacterium]
MGIFNKKTTEKKSEVSKPNEKAVEKKVADKKPVVKATDKPVDTKKPAKKVVKATSNKKGYGTAYRVLVRPIISEKATLANSISKYIFEVAVTANKIEVKKAIEEVYGVSPKAIHMINARGKFVRFGRKTGHTKNTKKAIVTLKKGDSITIYEGI